MVQSTYKINGTLANINNDPCIYVLYTSQSWTTLLQFNDTVLVVFMRVGKHFDEQGTHLHLETHTPVTHVQTHMGHNSSPQVAGMKVGLVL